MASSELQAALAHRTSTFRPDRCPTFALIERERSLKWAAIATDALRAKALKICGYRTQVVEFIDLEHTARNVLIRATRQRSTDQASSDRAVDDYQRFRAGLGIASFHLETAIAP